MAEEPLQIQITLPSGEQRSFDNVDFLSFVNGGTFGKPPILTRTDGTEGVTGPVVILYVNTDKVAAVEVERDS